MRDVNCVVGRKTFSLKCEDQDAEKIIKLSTKLNEMIAKNSNQYKNLSDDNLLFITALELIDICSSIQLPNLQADEKSTDVDFSEKLNLIKEDQSRVLLKISKIKSTVRKISNVVNND